MSNEIVETGVGLESASESKMDRQMDSLVGYLLLVGVVSSGILILSGVVWHWLSTGTLAVEYRIRGMNLFEFALKSLEDLSRGGIRSRLLVNLGIVTLMLTPFVRVLASMLYFAFAERNFKYTVFTAVVLAILSYSLFLR